jgi:hypothetical protein
MAREHLDHKEGSMSVYVVSMIRVDDRRLTINTQPSPRLL